MAHITELLRNVYTLDQNNASMQIFDEAVSEVLMSPECPKDFTEYLNASFENFRNIPSRSRYLDLQGSILVYQWVNFKY